MLPDRSLLPRSSHLLIKREITIENVKFHEERMHHEETQALSEKRRVACVKLRSQGVALVRANNGLEARKLSEERRLKHELNETRRQLSDVRLSLSESQSALTVSCRYLSEELFVFRSLFSNFGDTELLDICFSSSCCCISLFSFFSSLSSLFFFLSLFCIATSTSTYF